MIPKKGSEKMNLKGKNVVITGASSGIGEDTLKLLLKEGANVLAVSRKMSQSSIKNDRLVVMDLDLSSKASVDLLFTKAFEIFNSIDIFISNAGFTYYERLFETTEKTHR